MDVGNYDGIRMHCKGKFELALRRGRGAFFVYRRRINDRGRSAIVCKLRPRSDPVSSSYEKPPVEALVHGLDDVSDFGTIASDQQVEVRVTDSERSFF